MWARAAYDGECREVTRCGWCQVGGHAEAVCWKRVARCVKCGGHHHGISSEKGNEGCTADHRSSIPAKLLITCTPRVRVYIMLTLSQGKTLVCTNIWTDRLW